jgi:quercetin dioxygenase-like cupin family protein
LAESQWEANKIKGFDVIFPCKKGPDLIAGLINAIAQTLWYRWTRRNITSSCASISLARLHHRSPRGHVLQYHRHREVHMLKLFPVIAIALAPIWIVPVAADPGNAESRPPPGSNQVLRAPLTMAQGLEVIISDVVIPANATVPRHYHPGEEFVYVIEVSAVHVEEGKPDILLKAGDSYVISPRAIHSPRGGAEGARAIVFRVHRVGEEESIAVE